MNELDWRNVKAYQTRIWSYRPNWCFIFQVCSMFVEYIRIKSVRIVFSTLVSTLVYNLVYN